ARVLAEERHAPRDAHRAIADPTLYAREHADLGGGRCGERRAVGGVGRRGGVVDELGHELGPPVRRKGRSGTADGLSCYARAHQWADAAPTPKVSRTFQRGESHDSTR